MAGMQLGAALRHIHHLFAEGSLAGLSDAQLLERFFARRDEGAFAMLVGRHGPLVLATCRALVRDRDDAEDAFQATFLLLARKGGALRDRAALGGWLHRVARRVACQSVADARRRRRQEREAGLTRFASPSDSALPEDLGVMLHEEIDRLSDRHRLPLILCHLEELSHAQAARQLRWSERTLRRRLTEARERLRSRLTRRGVAVPAAMLGAALAREASAAVPEGWPAAMVRTAMGASAGRSPVAVLLAGRVSKAMLLTRLKLIAAAALAAGTIACLVAGITPVVAGGDAEPPPPGAQPRDVRPTPGPRTPHPARAEANVEEGTITFAGRVVDPQGKPFAGAALSLICSPFGATPPQAKAVSGPDGRFRFNIPKAEVEDEGVDRKSWWSKPQVVATADGFGPDWHEAVRTGADDLEMRLVKDVPITGRVLDLEGRPVAGARVVVRAVATTKGDDLTAYVATVADGTEDGNGRLLGKRWEGRFPGQPEEVRTDAGGRFRMSGFGGERLVEMGIEGPAIESLTFLAMTRAAPDVGGPGEKSLGSGAGRLHGAAFDLLVRPGRVITGVIRDKATRRPLAGMRVGMLGIAAHGATGEDGRFTVPGFGKANKYRLFASPQHGQPYFVTCAVVPDAAGLAPIEADIDCVRGIPFRLRLVDRETGKPVNASVTYWLLHPNPISREVPGYDTVGGFGTLGSAHREADGTYVGAVLPGPGAITIATRDDRYAPACVDPRAFFKVGPEVPKNAFQGFGDLDRLYIASGNSQSGMPQSQFSAIVLTNPASDSGPLSFDVALVRDPKREVTILDPDGRPLAGAVVTGIDWKGGPVGPLEVATFTVSGLNPARVRRITIRHDERRLAGSLLLRGDEPEPSAVRLQPWGTITGRLVDAEGRPRPKAEIADGGGIASEEDPTRGRLPGRITTDEDGRFRVEALVPGQKYSARIANVKDGGEYGHVLHDVELEPRELLDVGDIRPTPTRDKDTP